MTYVLPSISASGSPADDREGRSRSLRFAWLAAPLTALRVPVSVLAPDFCGRVGFPAFELTNLGATIRTAEKRIAQLEHEATHGKPWRYLSATKYPGTCVTCGSTVERGATAAYRGDEIQHFDCALAAERAAELGAPGSAA